MNLSKVDALVFLLAFIRTSAMVLTLPKLGQGSYFLFFRLLLSVAICLATTPLFLNDSSIRTTDLDLFSAVMNEVGAGLCLGLAASCLVIALQAAGQIVSQYLGFQFGAMQQGAEPDESTDYRKLFHVAGVVFWFAIGGHRLAITGLLQSYATIPIGTAHFSESLYHWINLMTTTCLGFAIRFALPIVVVGSMSFLIAGFSARIIGSGQTNQVGITLNQLFAMILLPAMFLFFYHEINAGTFQQIESLLDSLRPSIQLSAPHP